MSNICNFQVFCEVYLQEEPSVDLFREQQFYLNRQNEFTDGPNLELGGISIQRRRDAVFPTAKLPSHPKDWNQTLFYCRDTSISDENPLSGFCEERLSPVHPIPGRLTTAEQAKYVSVLGTGVPRLACLRSAAWLHQRPGTAQSRH